MDEGGGRRRRRRHSEQFKAEAIAACRKPGASIAAAAPERSINANLLRRWVIEAERAEAGSLLELSSGGKQPLTLPNGMVLPLLKTCSKL